MKRAQSALEYLTTYGWALLGILAIIGVMSYMGFSDPTNKVPTSCNLGTTFSCGSFFATEEGDFAFEFTNMERTVINVTDVRCTFPGVPDLDIDVTDTPVGVGETAVIVCNPLAPLSLSKKELFEVRIQYVYNESSPLPRVSSGELIISTSDDMGILAQYEGDSRRIS